MSCGNILPSCSKHLIHIHHLSRRLHLWLNWQHTMFCWPLLSSGYISYVSVSCRLLPRSNRLNFVYTLYWDKLLRIHWYGYSSCLWKWILLPWRNFELLSFQMPNWYLSLNNRWATCLFRRMHFMWSNLLLSVRCYDWSWLSQLSLHGWLPLRCRISHSNRICWMSKRSLLCRRHLDWMSDRILLFINWLNISRWVHCLLSWQDLSQFFDRNLWLRCRILLSRSSCW